MQVYLPIAGISINALLLLAMGAAVGFLSGLFGVGGGFLVTPLLTFTGIPSVVAVATGANQVVASSVSGALAQWRRGNVDFKLGFILMAGGIFGSIIGVRIVKLISELGQIDFLINMSYVTLLGIVGSLMMAESVRSILQARAGKPPSGRRSGQHGFVLGLPFKMRFPRSKLYMSVIPPLALGAFIGLLSGIMGVGGGFIMVPALIYLLRVPTSVVFGTSLFQTVFVAGTTTILQATQNRSVDAVLAFLLIIGGVIGAQFGVKAAQRLKAEQLRFLLAALVLAVALRLAYQLVVSPDELFSLAKVRTELP